MSASPTAEANQITRYANRIGLHVERSHSALSEAIYLTIVGDADEDDPVEIRLATHDQRPSYARGLDYEFGPHGGGCVGPWWMTSLPSRLAEMAGADPEATVRKLQAEIARRQAAGKKAAATRRLAADEVEDRLVREYIERRLARGGRGAFEPAVHVAEDADVPQAMAARARRRAQGVWTRAFGRSRRRRGYIDLMSDHDRALAEEIAS